MDDVRLFAAAKTLADWARDTWKLVQAEQGSKFWFSSHVSDLCEIGEIPEDDWHTVKDISNGLLEKDKIAFISLEDRIQIAPRHRLGAAVAHKQRTKMGLEMSMESDTLLADRERITKKFVVEMASEGVTPAMIGNGRIAKRTQKLLEGRT